MNSRFVVVAACSGGRLTSSHAGGQGGNGFTGLAKPANPKANGPVGESNVAHAYVAPLAGESAWGRAKHNSAGRSFDVKANFHGFLPVIPEPATLSLLAVGVLMACRRRRR